MFPPIPKQGLSKEDVAACLLIWKENGWDVYANADMTTFVLYVNELERVTIAPTDSSMGKWRLTSSAACGRYFGEPDNQQALQAYLVRHIGGKWPVSPPSVRLVRGEPASNLLKLRGLLGMNEVQAVYDVHFGNPSLKLLIDLHSFGVKFAPNLRVLASMEKHNKGQLTDTFAKQALSQIGASNAEVRLLSPRGHEMRFLLLDDGDAVFPGASLNGLDTNEAPNRQRGIHDRSLFDVEWGNSSTMENGDKARNQP